MSKFTSTKNKLRKLWEKVEKDNINLSLLNNEDELEFFSNLPKNQVNKKVILLADSGYINVTDQDNITFDNSNSRLSITFPQDINIVTLDENDNTLPITTKKGTILPITYAYYHAFNINVPETMLPFIRIVPEVKKLPNHETNVVFQSASTTFNKFNEIIQITGDGSTLYKGLPDLINIDFNSVNRVFPVFESTELTDLEIPISNTKKLFKATVEYEKDGETFTIEGDLVRIFANFEFAGSCDPLNPDRDLYDCLTFQELGSFGSTGERGDNEVININSTSFTIKAQKSERRSVNVPPCTTTTIVTDGVELSSTFSATTSYTLHIVGEHRRISPSPIFLGSNKLVVLSSDDETINSKSFEFVGYRPYYSSNKEGRLTIDGFSTEIGTTLPKYILNDLPNTNFGEILPYSSIKLFRNFGTFDRTVFQSEDFIQHTKQIIPTYIKKSNNNFFFIVEGTFLLTTPATKQNPTYFKFPKYQDEYTHNSIQYSKTSENHDILPFEDTPSYIPEIIDTQLRIKVYLQNPLYWKENKTYAV